MKKTYQIPMIRIVALQQKLHLMSASDELRVTEGIDIPTSVSSTLGGDETTIFGKGQGYGTNRSREWFGDDDW